MAGRSLKTGGALVEVTVDTDIAKFPALKAGFMVVAVITSEGYVMVTAGPPDFSVGDGNFFFLG